MPDCSGKCVFVRWIVKPGVFTQPGFDALCGQPHDYTLQTIEDDLKKIANNWAENNSAYQQLCNEAGCHCAKKLEDETPGPAELVATVSRTVTFGPWKESHKVGEPPKFISCSYQFGLPVQLSKYRLECKCAANVAGQPAPSYGHPTGKECLGQCIYRQWWFKEADIHVTYHQDAGCPPPTAAIQAQIRQQVIVDASATLRSMSGSVSQCAGANCECNKTLDTIGEPGAGDKSVDQKVIPISTEGSPVVPKMSGHGTGAEEVPVTCHYWGTADVPFSAYDYTGECVPKSLQ